MNIKDFNTKKIKTIRAASVVKTIEELCSMDIIMKKRDWFLDPFLNQKIVKGYHDLVERLKQEEGFDIKEYKIAHRFIWSTARWMPRDTFDKRVKKELVHLLESHGVYPYTT